MKKNQYTKIGSIAALVGLMACTSENWNESSIQLQEGDVHSVQITARNFDGAEALSRTSVEIGADGAKFTWAESDTLGIFPNAGNQIAFPVKKGAGAQTAVFNGGGWALKSGADYTAYFPFRYENSSSESVGVTYTGQYQQGNGNTSHIGKYDYMATSSVTPTDGKVSFDFHHLGTLLQWKLKLPTAVNLTSLSLEAGEDVFVKNGTFSLKSDSQVIIATENTTTLNVGLGGVGTTENGQEVIVYMMMAPVDLTGKTYKVKITNDAGKYAEVELEGKKFEKGKAYSLTAEFADFVEERFNVDEYIGKVVSMEGGEVVLEAPSQEVCRYALSDEAKGWVSLVSSSQGRLVFQVQGNASDSNRRGFVRMEDLVSGRTIEYAILQGGLNTYAITESTARMPMGILSSNASATSEEHGLWALVDSDLDTYYEGNKSEELHISWEGPYDIPISRVEYGCDAGYCGLNLMTFHIATDGTDWDGLGWSVSHGKREGEGHIGVNGVTCRNRFYRLIVSTNHGGSTIRVSEFGVAINKNVEGKEITTLNDLMIFAEYFTENPATPMGNHFVDKHKTTDSDRGWLSNPDNEPSVTYFDDSFNTMDVNLFPFGNPSPADINRCYLDDYSLAVSLAEMAYLYPNFVKSLFLSSGNIYSVKMYDPQGQVVNITIRPTFLSRAILGKDGKANWATILEKAVLKWNEIYQLHDRIGNFKPEHVFPMFTSDGASFKISANLFSPKQLKQAVNVAFKEGLAVIGVSKKYMVSFNGFELGHEIPYSVMYSNHPDALFALRDPKGNNKNESEDGLLHVMTEDIVRYNLELVFFYSGDASRYFEKKLEPYIPPVN